MPKTLKVLHVLGCMAHILKSGQSFGEWMKIQNYTLKVCHYTWGSRGGEFWNSVPPYHNWSNIQYYVIFPPHSWNHEVLIINDVKGVEPP